MNQFRPIAKQRQVFAAAGNPRISIDAKTREQVGSFTNPGRRWSRQPVDVNSPDCPTDAVAQVVPYGGYDPVRNRGPVWVGTSANTADLAADTVLDWWRQHCCRQYPAATALMIEADGGGSNGSRSRVFKARLQAFADTTG